MLNPTGIKTTTHKNLLITAQNKQSKSNLQKFIPQKRLRKPDIQIQNVDIRNACEWLFLSISIFYTLKKLPISPG